MEIKVINASRSELPKHATSGSAGLDLRSNEEYIISIQPFGRKLIHTGIHIELPQGYEAQIRPRSGLALKKGLTVLNSPGTIDSDYRGEIGVILYNSSSDTAVVEPGERIAQMVIAKYEQVELVDVNYLNETDRGDGGYGHTGTK